VHGADVGLQLGVQVLLVAALPRLVDHLVGGHRRLAVGELDYVVGLLAQHLVAELAHDVVFHLARPGACPGRDRPLGAGGQLVVRLVVPRPRPPR
jgi:hypothetical protein